MLSLRETYENRTVFLSVHPPARTPSGQEILSFDHAHPAPRPDWWTIDSKIQDVKSTRLQSGQTTTHLLSFFAADERSWTTTDYSGLVQETPTCIPPNFWHMWQTTAAFLQIGAAL